MALKDKELPEGFEPDERVAEQIRERLTEGKLACATAFTIVRDLDVSPADVGLNADALGVRLTRCQLGLFGYPGKHGWTEENATELTVPDGLREALAAARDDAGDLPCTRAWDIATKYRVSRMQLGYLADSIGLHITPCQLGAF